MLLLKCSHNIFKFEQQRQRRPLSSYWPGIKYKLLLCQGEQKALFTFEHPFSFAALQWTGVRGFCAQWCFDLSEDLIGVMPNMGWNTHVLQFPHFGLAHSHFLLLSFTFLSAIIPWVSYIFASSSPSLLQQCHHKLCCRSGLQRKKKNILSSGASETRNLIWGEHSTCVWSVRRRENGSYNTDGVVLVWSHGQTQLHPFALCSVQYEMIHISKAPMLSSSQNWITWQLEDNTTSCCIIMEAVSVLEYPWYPCIKARNRYILFSLVQRMVQMMQIISLFFFNLLHRIIKKQVGRCSCCKYSTIGSMQNHNKTQEKLLGVLVAYSYSQYPHCLIAQNI